MKFKSLFLVAAASVATSFAFADQGDIFLTFSTQGPDKYADGATVADGEWYAVCWSANAAFGGLTTACKPAVAGDELILAAPLAKDGKCPFVGFEFARKDSYKNGKFSILMLDTRSAGGTPAARGADGLPVFVNAATAATSLDKNAGAAMVVDTASVAAVGATAADQATFATDTKLNPVTISAIEIVGANVQLTVSGFEKDANYVVKTGTAANNLNEFTVKTPGQTTDTAATFIIPKEKGNFFSIGTVAK